MKLCRIIIWIGLLGSGCSTNHLLFVENSHFGLKASFEPNSPTPAEVDLGWRRAMFAMVPQKDATGTPGSVTVTTDPTTKQQQIAIVPDPHELMSLYTVFHGNIGFGDPIEIRHFMATGVAASNLLADQASLRTVADSLNKENK